VAVVKDWRRRGIGGALLEALEFYRSQGFVTDGKIQQVDGLLRQAMRKPLAG
jgi:GNAT superfamily N-acetyltransferase